MKKLVKLSHRLHQTMTQIKNHKLMHKIGKQWVIIGISALVLSIGGVSISNNVHADNIDNTNATDKIQPIKTQAKALHAHIINHANKAKTSNYRPKAIHTNMKASHANENSGLIISNSSRKNYVKHNHRSHQGTAYSRKAIRHSRIRRNRRIRRFKARTNYVTKYTYRNYQRQIKTLQQRTRHGSRYSRRIARKSLARLQRQFSTLRIRKTVRRHCIKRNRRSRGIVIKKHSRRKARHSRKANRKNNVHVINGSDTTPTDAPSNNTSDNNTMNSDTNFVVSPGDNDNNNSDNTMQSNTQSDDQNNTAPSDDQSNTTPTSDNNDNSQSSDNTPSDNNNPASDQSNNNSDNSNNSDQSEQNLPAFRAKTLSLINQDRADTTGNAPLQESSDLDQIAQIRAQQASSSDQENQSDPHMDPATGKSYYEEVGKQLGYNVNAIGSDNYGASGENLAWGDNTPEDFNNAWYTDEKATNGGHFQNIVGNNSDSSHYNLVGIGVYHGTGAEVFADNVSSND